MSYAEEDALEGATKRQTNKTLLFMKLNVERTPGVDKGTLGYQRSVPGRFKAEVANEVSQSCSGKKRTPTWHS